MFTFVFEISLIKCLKNLWVDHQQEGLVSPLNNQAPRTKLHPQEQDLVQEQNLSLHHQDQGHDPSLVKDHEWEAEHQV